MTLECHYVVYAIVVAVIVDLTFDDSFQEQLETTNRASWNCIIDNSSSRSDRDTILRNLVEVSSRENHQGDLLKQNGDALLSFPPPLVRTPSNSQMNSRTILKMQKTIPKFECRVLEINHRKESFKKL